jgi:hypothetical protein
VGVSVGVGGGVVGGGVVGVGGGVVGGGVVGGGVVGVGVGRVQSPASSIVSLSEKVRSFEKVTDTLLLTDVEDPGIPVIVPVFGSPLDHTCDTSVTP